MMTGFLPCARDITVYVMRGFGKFEPLLKWLGKHKTGRSRPYILYIKRLEDIGEKVLMQLVADSVREMRLKYGQQ